MWTVQGGEYLCKALYVSLSDGTIMKKKGLIMNSWCYSGARTSSQVLGHPL